MNLIQHRLHTQQIVGEFMWRSMNSEGNRVDAAYTVSNQPDVHVLGKKHRRHEHIFQAHGTSWFVTHQFLSPFFPITTCVDASLSVNVWMIVHAEHPFKLNSVLSSLIASPNIISVPKSR